MDNYSLDDDIYVPSMYWKFDNPFLIFPLGHKGEVFTKVTTTLKDKNGTSLPNKKLFIISDSYKFPDGIIIYYSNHKDVIEIEKHNGIDGFYIESDDNGEILFFINVVKPQNLILILSSSFATSDSFYQQNALFITNQIITNYPDDFPLPDIINLHGRNIYSTGDGKFSFNIDIMKNTDIGKLCYILFFVDGRYTKKYIFFDKDQINGKFVLPSGIFVNNSLQNFTYIIFDEENGKPYPHKSPPLKINYTRTPNGPWPDVSRVYNPCVVTNSNGDVVEGNTITYQDINTDPNSSVGLFMKIVGTADTDKNPSLPPMGATVIGNVYITAANGNFNWTGTAELMIKPGGINWTTINIPRDFLENIQSFPNGPAKIYFDYQVGSDSDLYITYGQIWSGFIDTMKK
ncbi:hypothetical protein [Xenorhabdus stockiae]|nr:hypothetical protein [Xenorhabdus stockiae]